MDSKAGYTEDENIMIEAEFQEILNVYKTNKSGNLELINKSFQLAKSAHEGMRRRSGEPYILHPIGVALIVANDIGLGATSIACAFLHDVIEDTDYTYDDLLNLFGKKVADIVQGLTKLSGATTFQSSSLQAENFRKLLLTMSEDIRVILIKMADRLHNMRTLSSMPPHKQYKIAGETLFIYAPLAHRLGLFNIKSELEDLAFKYEHPTTYEEILLKIDETAKSRHEFFEAFSKPIIQKLKLIDLEFEMQERVKSVYSIWRKMQRKNVPFEEVYDLMAIRIIFKPKLHVDEKIQCWNIYSAITDIYRPKPDRIRDWVSNPKANGYEALHLTVMSAGGRWVEIQVRSDRMDEVAEKGYAAHWKYKSGHEGEETELEKWLKTIRELLESPDLNAVEFLDDFKLNLFSREIMVFTPKGDMKVIPQGATALDFAFDIHTDIGYTCIGAKVNHRLVPLSYVLQSGDQVEVLNSKKQKPQEEWIDFVSTARAKQKIKAAFKQERKQCMKDGETILENELQKLKLTTNGHIIRKILGHFKINKKEELLYKIGRDKLDVKELSKILQNKPDNRLVKYWRLQFGKGTKKKPTVEVDAKSKAFQISDDTDVNDYSVADCCHPIPGDDVIGYKDEENHLEIHQRKCPEAIKLMSNYGNSIVEADWISHKLLSFLAIIKITGIDSLGMVSKITKIISDDQAVNMRTVHFESFDGIFDGIIHLYIHHVEDVNNLILKLMKVKGINSVLRVEKSQAVIRSGNDNK